MNKVNDVISHRNFTLINVRKKYKMREILRVY